MGVKSKSDISNSAIRMLLQEAGATYDEARGYKKFNTKSGTWKKVSEYFYNSCSYCGTPLDSDDKTNDHLLPINKTALGLHAWGNIVPCCRRCNKEKHHGDWRTFLKLKCDKSIFKKRELRIVNFQRDFKYEPTLNLREIANNLYEDIGEVSSTLIRLRLKQAEAVINEMVGKGISGFEENLGFPKRWTEGIPNKERVRLLNNATSPNDAMKVLSGIKKK